MNFQQEAVQIMNSDFKDLSEAASKLANHAIKFAGIGWGGSFFGFFAAVAAMYVVFNSIYNYIALYVSRVRVRVRVLSRAS